MGKFAAGRGRLGARSGVSVWGPVPQRPRGSSFAEASGLAAEVGGRPVEPQVELTPITLHLLSLDLGTAFCDHALLLWKGGVFLTVEEGLTMESRLGACLGISPSLPRPFQRTLGQPALKLSPSRPACQALKFLLQRA